MTGQLQIAPGFMFVLAGNLFFLLSKHLIFQEQKFRQILILKSKAVVEFLSLVYDWHSLTAPKFS